MSNSTRKSKLLHSEYELIEFTEKGKLEFEELPYKFDSEEKIAFTEKGKIETENLPYDKKTRRIGFYILIVAFVLAVLGCEVYAMVTGNEKLINEVLSLFKTIMLLVLGYYFAKRD